MPINVERLMNIFCYDFLRAPFKTIKAVDVSELTLFVPLVFHRMHALRYPCISFWKSQDSHKAPGYNLAKMSSSHSSL